ncbi:hypothetical protein [Actinorugispora endophytica]|nr:hypothetical protein [Actinorugispora endophytica]
MVKAAAAGAAVVFAVLSVPPAAADGTDGGGAPDPLAAELGGDPAPEILEAVREGRPLVHPRVSDRFPSITADSVAGVLGEDTTTRVAVLPAVEADPDAVAEDMHEGRAEGAAVLYVWHDGGFRPHLAGRGDGAGPKGALATVGSWAAPGELLRSLAQLETVLRGDVISRAAESLADSPLHVPPCLRTDLGAARAEELADRFAAVPARVRVALLPSEAVEYESAVARRGSGNVAELVQGESDMPVIVYLVDPGGRVVSSAASGRVSNDRFGLRGDDLAGLANSVRDRDSADTTLTNLLRRLGGGDDGGSAAFDRAAEFLIYAAPFLALVGLVLVLPSRRAERD